MMINENNKHVFLLFALMLISVLNRLRTPLVIGSPYGMDFFEFSSYTLNIKTLFDPFYLPHGPIFYWLLLPCKLFGVGGFLFAGTYIFPIILAFTIIPLYFIAKYLFSYKEAGYLSLLVAGSTNIIIHQTGSTVVPESLGILFAVISLFFLLKLQDSGGFRYVILSFLFLLLLTLSHHLTTFLCMGSLLFAFFSLIAFNLIHEHKKIDFIYKPILVLTLWIVFTLLYWYYFTFDFTIKLILGFLNINALLLISVIISALFAIILFPFFISSLDKKDYQPSLAPWLTSFVGFVLLDAIVWFAGYSDFLVSVNIFGLPIALTVLPIGWIGIRSFLSKENSDYKKIVMLAMIIVPFLASMLLMFLSDFAFLSYRVITLALVFFVPFVANGILAVISKTSKNIRYTLIIVLAYSLFALSMTSNPGREFLHGIDESYSRGELDAAKVIVRTMGNGYSVDTDVRFGDLLLFFSEGKIGNVGNRLYFQNLTDSWLFEITQYGILRPISGSKVIIITNSMLKDMNGVVVLPFYMRLKPIDSNDMDYLIDQRNLSKVFDSRDCVVFICRQAGS